MVLTCCIPSPSIRNMTFFSTRGSGFWNLISTSSSLPTTASHTGWERKPHTQAGLMQHSLLGNVISGWSHLHSQRWWGLVCAVWSWTVWPEFVWSQWPVPREWASEPTDPAASPYSPHSAGSTPETALHSQNIHDTPNTHQHLKWTILIRTVGYNTISVIELHWFCLIYKFYTSVILFILVLFIGLYYYRIYYFNFYSLHF